MRKLASVKKIDKLSPIEGADRIELAHVGGWKVVVAKDVGHKEGDLVVYCEVDSFLPIEPEFEFLHKSSYKKLADGKEGYRLKTIKLRGQISQGLIIPLKDAYEIYHRRTPNLDFPHWFEGLDVTDMLGITKYEPPIPAELNGIMKGGFPSFLKKTDEERVQNLSEEYKEWVSKYKNNFYLTEKLDGSSATFYVKDGGFGVCSRNLELQENENNTFWKVAHKLDLKKKLQSLGKNICLQGELIGEGIQGNPYKIKGQTVKFFNAFNIDEHKKLDLDQFLELMGSLELESVPIIRDFTLPETIYEILKLAEGKSKLNPNTEREGFVVRSYDMSISFKVISNKFLLKEK